MKRINIKMVWLVLPIVLMPYIVLAALISIFLSTKLEFLTYFYEEILHNNALLLLPILFAWAVFSLAMIVIFLVICFKKGVSARFIAKAAMTVKLLQLPGYILIFSAGFLMMITIFTIPFTILLCLFDCLMLAITAVLNIGAVVLAVKQGMTKYKKSFWVILLQFVFCLDVVASVLFFFMLKKASKRQAAVCDSAAQCTKELDEESPTEPAGIASQTSSQERDCPL